jgi:hypothetical protein
MGVTTKLGDMLRDRNPLREGIVFLPSIEGWAVYKVDETLLRLFLHSLERKEKNESQM